MKKEMKLSIILLLIGIILLSPSFVHAETLNVSENSKFNNTNIPVWYEISPYRNILFSYEDWRLYSGDPNNANFGYIDICIYGGVTVNNNNADCSDGCLNNINLYDTGISCKIEYPNQVNANGRRYFIFFNIKKWGMKNSDTLPYFQDYLTFARTTGYDPIIDFNMVFLSNEDLYVQYANNNKIQELIEQSNQAIENSTQNIINNQNTNTSSIINGIDGATQEAIDNANQNKEDIINNQNANTDKEIESQQVCDKIDKNNTILNGALGSTGNISSVSDFGVTDYIKIDSNSKINRIVTTNESNAYTCFYNINKSFISCIANFNQSIGILTIPDNASYVRFTIKLSSNKPQFEICRNGNQAMNDSINDMKDMDIGSEDKEVPSDDKYQDYEEQEQILKDSMEQADLNDLDIAIDVPTSDFIWQTITRLINSNSLVFGMFIAILSIGIIKLAFGR